MPAMVVVPSIGHGKRRVSADKVQAILSNRVINGVEQYLVQWKMATPSANPPLSWHCIEELVRCLEEVQDYLDTREKWRETKLTLTLKRKSPDTPTVHERRSSPFHPQFRGNGNAPASRSPSVSPATPSTASPDVYNGILKSDDDGFVFCSPSANPEITTIELNQIPLPDMKIVALQSRTDTALRYIRAEYVRRLDKVPGKPIHLLNLVDASTPSLRFRYISDYVLTEGVYRASTETQQGCTKCSPHMGRGIGCEYTKKCDCLEYAAVDEARLTDPSTLAEYNAALATGGSTIGFPKKFPYFAEGTKREKTGCLVPFYLHSRRPIYECNAKCACGPTCRNKNVQFGRTVELEIFRTAGGRGWGLRCAEALREGQFIDTYRGEIITDAEATRREDGASKAKASYLYSLDKFAESEGLAVEEIYVVDGEFMGGPTKFMNHSCEPNCRQYTVSYNKHDCKVYDIAFFACKYIPAGEELTFDYLDKDEGSEMDEPGEDAIPCLCGAEKCRKWLWT